MNLGARKAGFMQAKEIPDRPILELLATPGHWATHWDTEPGSYSRSLSPCFPPGCPEKLRRAKMLQLKLRGLVSGCCCGCRGDFEITAKGREWLMADR